MVGAMSEAAPATTPEATNDRGPAAGVTWDLGDLYAGPDDPRLEADLAGALDAAQRFAERHRSRVAGLDAAELAAAIDELEAFEEPAYRAAAFAQLLFAADTSAPRHGALLQRVQERGTEIRNAARLLRAGVGRDRRRARRRAARRTRAGAPSPSARTDAEVPPPRALGSRRAAARRDRQHGTARLLAALRRDARLAALPLEVADGKTEEKSEEEMLSLLYEPDRELRRRAADSLTRGLRENSRLLAFVFNTLVQDKATRDRLRHYASPIDERNLANEIDDETVQALMTACERRGALVARYYRLKAKLLGLPELEDYDRYAPVLAADGQRSFDAARTLVLEAYGDFSPRLAEIAGHFFERRWIDAELRPGKRGGAFSASTIPSAHPYVLLNYTGTLRDVMTVAHELGHGVHQYLSRARGLFEHGHAAHHRGDGQRVRRDADLPPPAARRAGSRASGSACSAASSRTPSPPCSARW